MTDRTDAPPPHVVNIVQGDSSGTVVQAAVVNGGVHNHQYAAAPRVQLPHRAGRVPIKADGFQERDLSSVLAAALADGQTAVLTSQDREYARVLRGLGGVGKTQLAADHAERLWQSGGLDLLVWITASARDAIIAEYARLAADLLGHADPDPEHAARRFLAWLSSTSARWLVVLDDLQRPEHLRELWPPEHPTGSVIVTTRRTDASLLGHGRRVVEVGLFTPEESVSYLTAKLPPDLADDVAGVARALQHLPLALAQAAAYMLDRAVSCSGYVTRFEDRRKKLADLVPPAAELPDDYGATVATTWSLSVDFADELSPTGLATPVLDLMSVLDPNGIPAEFFATSAVLAHLSAVTGRNVPADVAREAVTCLKRLSLVDVDWRESTARVHALVQRATRDDFTDDEQVSVPGAVAGGLRELWQAASAMDQSLRANTEALHAAAGPQLWTAGDHDVLFRAGTSLGESGHVAGALRYFEKLCDEAALHLGAGHVAALDARQHAGCWQAAAGFREQAADALKMLVRDQSELLGAAHESVLATRCYLAEFSDNGCGMDAAELHELAVDAMTALGPDHHVVLRVLGDLVRSQDARMPELVVSTLYRKVIANQQRVVGAAHRDTFRTRRHLASWRSERRDRFGALEEFERLVRDQVQALGRDHPDVLASRGLLMKLRGGVAEDELERWKRVSNAGATITVSRDRQRARMDVELSLRQVYQDNARLLGDDHPDTVQAWSDLQDWTVYGVRREDVDIATRRIGELKRRLDALQSYFGALTPTAFELRADIARLYRRIGEVATASQLLEELRTDLLAVGEPNVDQLFDVRRELVWHRAESGDRTGAVRMLAEITGGTAGDSAAHADLRYWTGNACAEVQADITELRRILGDDMDRFGADHRYTLHTRHLLASRLGAAGRCDEAVAMLRQTYEACVRAMGVDHPVTIRVKGELEWWRREQVPAPPAS